MGCCQHCDQGVGNCLETSLATRQTRVLAPRRVGAISTASVAGVPVVATVGAVGGGWGGWELAKMVSKKSMLLKIVGAAAGAWVGYSAAPAVTDAVGL